MREPTPAELLAQLAAMQEQVAKLQQQLTAQQSESGGLVQADSVAAGVSGVAVDGNVIGNITKAEAVGEHSVAVGRDIHKSTVISGNNNIIQIIQQYTYEYLCSVHSQFSKELDLGQLSNKFRDQCKSANLEFTEQAQVQVEVAHKKWTITDNTKRYAVQRDNQTLNLFSINHNLNNQQQLGRQIAEYLAWLYDRFKTIELRGIHREGRQVVQLALETIYVPLEANTYNNSDENIELELNEILKLGNRLVITGGPGSGKTTVLQHIACTLALAIATATPQLAWEKLGLDPADSANALLPLPIFVPLSTYVQERRNYQRSEDRTLAAFITRYLIERQAGFDLPRDFFVRLLKEGRGVILLLDGLDEVPDEQERAAVRQAIEDLVTGRANQQVVVTCRTIAYRNHTALGKGFQEVKVKPLTDNHVEALIAQAYAAIYANNSRIRQAKVAEILRGIHKLEVERRERLGDGISRFIDSPLLVRMLIIVHLSDRRMPEHRAELYMRATENMLWPQYLLDEEVATRIGRLIGGSHERHRELLQHLAFVMHSNGDQQGREFEEMDLRVALTQVREFVPFIEDFIALTRLRGTLLEERLGIYRFIHLGFQEYLVACYLSENIRSTSGIEGIATFFEEGPILETWWREPALLVAGYLNLRAPRAAHQLLRRLAGSPEAVPKHRNVLPEIQFAAAEVAIMACLEWFAGEQVLLDEVAHCAAALLDDAVLMIEVPLQQRIMLSDTLAHVGDPRQGVGLKRGLPNINWIQVEGGHFTMGSTDRLDRRPQFVCTLISKPYYISRYPITVAQYQAFVRAKGYEKQKYWTEAGWKWRKQNTIQGPERYSNLLQKYWTEKGWEWRKAKESERYSEVFQLSNHPQVGVSWYEAVAFCNWLSLELDRKICLPSEAQWERAARHTDGRCYPWLVEGKPSEYCNLIETNIGTTSAVGIFPSGDSMCGAADLAGNVWEWCSTQWISDYEEYETLVTEDLDGSMRRVLRGGSFYGDLAGILVQGAHRDSDLPDKRNPFTGFRVVYSAI